jgi:hypothetical protein
MPDSPTAPVAAYNLVGPVLAMNKHLYRYDTSGGNI